MLVDSPTEDLDGPILPGLDELYMKMYGPIPAGVDDPYMQMYGPMPPMPWENHTISKEEEKDEDNKKEKEEDTGGIRGFFARIFGKKHS